MADVIPVFGFYLQPAVGGRVLPYSFWRRFAEIDNVVAIKIAPFNRYQTLDVVRAVVESGRDGHRALHGQRRHNRGRPVDEVPALANRTASFAGGLLGHWAVWTRCAVSLLEDLKSCQNPHYALADAGRRKSPTQTPRFSTPPTAFTAASRVFTKSYGVRVCSRAAGAWTRTRICRPARWKRSTASTAGILI